MKAFKLTVTLSLSLNCEVKDKNRRAVVSLPLAWVSMSLSKWQKAIYKIKTAFTVSTIIGNSLAYGVGL